MAFLIVLVVLAGTSVARSSWAVPADGSLDPSVTVIDKLPIFDSGSSAMVALVFDPKMRRGYQISTPGTGGNTFPVAAGTNGTVVWSFDLDTLKPIQKTVIDRFSPAKIGSGPTAGSDVVHAVDEQAGRIYLSGTRPGIGGLAAQTAVTVIDEAKLEKAAPDAVTFLNTPEAQLPQLAGRVVYGMALRRVEERLKVVLLASTDLRHQTGGQDNDKPRDHYLVQWDAAPGPNGAAVADWTTAGGNLPDPKNPPGVPTGLAANGTYRIGSCQNAALVMSGGEWVHALGVLPHPTGIYIGCQGSGNVMLAVQVSFENGKPSADRPFPFPRQSANVLADVKGGRLLFEAISNGSTWVAFDAATQSYVGTAGLMQWTGFFPSAGLDERSGRLYTLAPDHLAGLVTPTQGGLMISDARLTPMPQFANVRPDLAYPAQSPILVDPMSPAGGRRLFVRKGTGLGTSMYVYPTKTAKPTPVEDFYHVLHDTIPVALQRPFASVDANTVPVPEESGVAEATYEGNASGFGFRSLLIGGINAVAHQQLGHQLGVTVADCYRTDRETVIGFARSARLSSLVASGAATSFDVDAALKADVERPVSRCWPQTFQAKLPDGVNNLDRDPRTNLPEDQQPVWDENAAALYQQAKPRWNDADYQVECIGSDGERHKDSEVAALEFSTTVTCRQGQERVNVVASGEGPGAIEGLVSVAHASAEATTRRDPKKGLVANVDAVAKGIEINAGDVHASIGLIRTEGESFAAGLPGTAGSDAKDGLKRTICGVHAPGFDLRGCTNDVRQVVAELNRSPLSRYGEFRLREPDPAYAEGSPGGYLAAIQRDVRQAFNDRIVTRDASNAIPGLEFIVWRADDKDVGAGRQVFQFAAVEAVTTYGISCVQGSRPDGKGCLAAPMADSDDSETGGFEASSDDGSVSDSGDIESTGYEGGGTTTVTHTPRGENGGGLGRVLRRLVNLPIEGLKLLFSSPREMGLMAAVWGLLWLPCYLGERRRLLAGTAARSTG